MKKIGFFGLLIFWVLCLGVTVNGAMLSPAISVMQEDFEMIKTVLQRVKRIHDLQ